MNMFALIKRLPVIMIVGVTLLVITACTIRLREQGNEATASAAIPEKPDALGADLVRCRSLTSDQAPAYEQCRKIWAENRRRFLGQSSGAAERAGTSSLFVPKDQSRMPQTYPSIVSPEGGDQ
jgi:conjugative transfer region protein TrbK